MGVVIHNDVISNNTLPCTQVGTWYGTCTVVEVPEGQRTPTDFNGLQSIDINLEQIKSGRYHIAILAKIRHQSDFSFA